MKVIKRSFFAIVVLFLFQQQILLAENRDSSSNSDSDIYVELQYLLNNYKDLKYLDITALRQQANSIDDPEIASKAIIELWKMEKYDLLELLWWKHEQRVIRTLIASLFYTQHKSTASNFPAFEIYLSRFEVAERRKREEELKIVVGNKNKLSIAVNQILNPDK